MPATTCQSVSHRKVSRGILGKGRESFTTVPGICGRTCAEGSDLCAKHLAEMVALRAKLAAKRAGQ